MEPIYNDNNEDLNTNVNSKIAELQLEKGDQLHKEGNFSTAFEIYENVLNKIGNNKKDLQIQSAVYHRLGLVSIRKANFKQSLDFLSKALEIKKSLDHTDILGIVSIMLSIGEAYFGQAQYSEAKSHFQNSLNLLLENYGEEHIRVIICYNNLANLYEQQEKHLESLAFLEKAVRIAKIKELESSEEISDSYYLLGRVYERLAEYEKALDFTNKSLKIKEKLNMGRKHPDIAMCFNSIGNIYLRQSKYNDALEMYSKGLAIFVEFLGENHPRVASFYNNIGLVYYSLESFEAALVSFKKSLEISTQLLGENHPNIADTYYNLACTLVDKNDSNEALEYFKKALSIQLQVYGENHPAIATTYNELGSLCRDLKDYSNSQINLDKALSIRLRNFGPIHPFTASCYHNLGLLYFDKMEFDKSLRNYIISLKGQNDFSERYFTRIAASFFNLGLLFENVRDLDSFESFMKKAKIIFQKGNSKDHEDTKNCESQLKTNEKNKLIVEMNNDFHV